MTDPSQSPQPEAVWYFPPKKRRIGPMLLIIGLSVVGIAIAAALVIFFVTRGAPAPVATETPSPSPSITASATPTPTPTATPSPTPTPTVTETPVTTPPPVPDPGVDAFAGQVGPRLDAALTGLGFAADETGQGGVQVVESLIGDAEWLSDRAAPSSIADDWSHWTSTYIARLSELRTAFANNGDTTDPLAAARAAMSEMRALVGR